MATMSLVACAPRSHDTAGGTCCQFTGPLAHDCAAIEKLGPGADLDGRCNQVNQGQSCSWDYGNKACCKIAVDDGFGNVTCGDSGTCCQFTGPMAHDCASIEKLGPGADLDGRCNQVNQGQSCSWDYTNKACCKIAVDDGFGSVTCGNSGTCCQFTGPMAHDCASIEKLGPGADLDGRCNQVNQGQSCSWKYGNDSCCLMAVKDGFPGSVQCP
jgi:hypothetical protein